ncbi:MAG: aldolase/citrate lyase family protein [archaeon]|nr:aldolase/citrate lyase family protein [archaeon]
MVREKLYSGKTCLGTFLTIGNTDVADILKHLGFDWFVFDTEHSYLSTFDLKAMMQALEGSNVSPIVRIGQIDQYLVKRALDVGSEGLLAPLVNSAEEAERLVKFAMYPPDGVRGAGPGRAARYGLNLTEYYGTANRELLICVQIETKEALSNVDEILATKRIDVGFVGPTDLTISLGLGTDRSNPKVIEAMQKVVKSCNDHGKIAGTLAATVDEAKKFQELGFRFVSLASDSRFLVSGARTYLSGQ